MKFCTIKTTRLFTILATAKIAMEKHPKDFENTLPIVNELLKKTFEEWNADDDIIIDKSPF